MAIGLDGLYVRSWADFAIWKHVDRFSMAREAVAFIPGAPRIPDWSKFTKGSTVEPDDERWLEHVFFEEQFRKAGFVHVESVLQKNVTRLKSAEEFVELYGGLTRNAVMNPLKDPADRARIEPHFGDALLRTLKTKFGDGEVTLDWEAWCITASSKAQL